MAKNTYAIACSLNCILTQNEYYMGEGVKTFAYLSNGRPLAGVSLSLLSPNASVIQQKYRDGLKYAFKVL